MKKWIALFLSLMMTTVLTACSSGEQVPAQTPAPTDAPQTAAAAENADVQVENTQNESAHRILIAYFTVPETDGVDTVAGASRVATDSGVMGNVEFIAKEIQKNVGGDLFAINTVQQYPGTHDALLEFAYNEKSDNARPELASHIENLSDYDVIFIGYPKWYDMPMAMYTFFDEYDFSGKTLIPFVTHGGSGFSGTIRTIQGLEPNATVMESGLSISRNNVAAAQADVKAWTERLNLE